MEEYLPPSLLLLLLSYFCWRFIKHILCARRCDKNLHLCIQCLPHLVRLSWAKPQLHCQDSSCKSQCLIHTDSTLSRARSMLPFRVRWPALGETSATSTTLRDSHGHPVCARTLCNSLFVWSWRQYPTSPYFRSLIWRKDTKSKGLSWGRI